MLKAEWVGVINNKRVHKVPVEIVMNDSRLCATVAVERINVLAWSATDAANWVTDRIARPETEIHAYGPHGGKVSRFVGWETAVGKMMFGRLSKVRQLALFN